MQIASQLRRQRPNANQYVTGPLKLTLEGTKDASPGEWLLREFKKANERYTTLLPINPKRAWWWPF